MPAVFFRASLTVSRLRSSIRRSVTTVTDCGMSRSCCRPLPMRVSVARSASLPSGVSACSRTTTVGKVFSAPAGAVWAMAFREPASSMAPSGSITPEFAEVEERGRTRWAWRRVFLRCDMEAVVERVVGWLQRTALWLAGKTMLLQTRTIRNKVNQDGHPNPIFVAPAQHQVESPGRHRLWLRGRLGHAATQQKLSIQCKLSMRLHDSCRL
ncbi:hypothetical protein Y695_01935 [Hydrogenophaga sp. T4]|nr:hypothetical protein Y695_01935 [Hydrogenophaga sp. T4]